MSQKPKIRQNDKTPIHPVALAPNPASGGEETEEVVPVHAVLNSVMDDGTIHIERLNVDPLEAMLLNAKAVVQTLGELVMKINMAHYFEEEMKKQEEVPGDDKNADDELPYAGEVNVYTNSVEPEFSA